MKDTILRIDDGRAQGMNDYMSTGANALSDDPYSGYTAQDFANAAKIVILSPNSTNQEKTKAFKVLQGADPKGAADLLNFLRSEILVHTSTPAGLRDRKFMRVPAGRMRDGASSSGSSSGDTGTSGVNASTALNLAKGAVNSSGGSDLAKVGGAALTGVTVGSALGPIGAAVGGVLGAGVGFLENLFSGGGGSPQGADPQRPGRSNGDARTFIEQLNNIYSPDPAYAKVFPALQPQFNVDSNFLSLINIDPNNLNTWHQQGLIDQDLFDAANGGWFTSWDRSNFFLQPGKNGNTSWCWYSIPQWQTKGLYNSDQVTFVPNTGGILCYLNIGRNGNGNILLPFWYLVTLFTDGTIRYDAVAPGNLDVPSVLQQIQDSLGALPTKPNVQNPNASASTAASGTVGKSTPMFVTPSTQSATGANTIMKNAATGAGAGAVALHACGASGGSVGGIETMIMTIIFCIALGIMTGVVAYIFERLHFKKIILSLYRTVEQKWQAVKKVAV